MPTRAGLISGLFMGIARGAGVIADPFGLTATRATSSVIILLATVLFALVGYPLEKDGAVPRADTFQPI